MSEFLTQRRPALPHRGLAGRPGPRRDQTGGRAFSLGALSFGALSLILLTSSCAHHESGRYQVQRLELRGQEHLAERPVEACLITRERPRFALTLGLGDPTCGEPPFDSQAPRLNLWRWWWTDWPAFNRAIFDEDRERILRWYRARGYYDARIVDVRFDPPEASDPAAEPDCDLQEEVCPLRIVVTIDEGEPTLLEQVRFTGLEELEPRLVEQLEKAGSLSLDEPLDESHYDAAKERMREVLRAAGYANPRVDGRVDVTTTARRARVEYRIETGALYTFGELTLEGEGELTEKPIVAAASLPTGQRFDPKTLREIQAEVYALGAFSFVEVHEEIDEQAEKVNVRLSVAPRAPHALRLGVGVLSGAQRRTSTGETTSIPQWDIHLFARYERRHVLGTLGRLTIEDRPRMIFSRDFPRTTLPNYGNLLSVQLNQPGLIEKRTDLFTENAWDYGPDPFLGFYRSDLFFRVGVRRAFFSRRLIATLALQQDLFLVNSAPENVTTDGSERPSSYGYSYLEEDLRLDLRDNPARPKLGAFFGLNASQAPRWQGSDWTAHRLAPEARIYLPLFLDIVWASRFALAGFFITNANPALDDTSRALGPNTYRLRGGGANSNRGFLAGQLGVGRVGGVRRWEGSSEIRVPFGRDFVLAGFADVGDVNDEEAWRFAHLNFTAGFGFRYYTILGAIRLDTGLRVLRWQRLDGQDPTDADDARLFGAPGALHLTIGDAF